MCCSLFKQYCKALFLCYQENSMNSVFDYEVEEDIENSIDTTALNDVPRRVLHILQNVIKYVKQINFHLYICMNKY